MRKNSCFLGLLLAFLSCNIFAYTPNFQSGSCQEIANIEAFKEFDELLLLIQKRLAVMHEVARWKWNEGAAIEDKQRDQLLTEKLLQTAKEVKIPIDFAKRFIQAQIDAAVIVQKEDFEGWVADRQEMFDPVCELESELRPYITQLSKTILEKLGIIYPFISNCFQSQGFIQEPLSRRSEDQISSKSWEKALSPFQQMK